MQRAGQHIPAGPARARLPATTPRPLSPPPHRPRPSPPPPPALPPAAGRPPPTCPDPSAALRALAPALAPLLRPRLPRCGDVADPQIIEQGVEEARLVVREIAARLFLQQREKVDRFLRERKIGLLRLAAHRVGSFAQVDQRGRAEREDERVEIETW